MKAGLAVLAGVAFAAPAALAASQPQTVTVVATEYQFAPNELTFRRGVEYRLHFVNRGRETHEFTAPQFFAAVRLRNPAVLNPDRTEIIAQPGQAKDVDFVPLRAGHYDLRCADHDWAGMTGAITVE